jgi:UDP-glucuronate 4-epimerase
MKYLVTGAAGFIGFHTATLLLERGDAVVGFDNLNPYYDVSLKEARLGILGETAKKSGAEFIFLRGELADMEDMKACFSAHEFDRVIHLAAQAGVRHSLENPRSYVESNLVGFANLLEAVRVAGTPHLTFASTSSVYGANTKLPYSEHDCATHPLQFYAATKRANELMGHAYSHLFRLPMTGLRFFTVYGPWGRPDMALFKFTKNIIEGQPIPVFNEGRHRRDFTYVADVAESVVRVADTIAAPDPDWNSAHPDPQASSAPFRILNVGNSDPVELIEYIRAIEDIVGKKAAMEMLPLQPGDVPDTHADVSELRKAIGFVPKTAVRDGIARFVEWYRGYYGV